MGRSVLYGVLALLLIAAFALTQFRIQPDERPVGGVDEILALANREDVSVLFILIDTLRADHLGAYGYERDTSPTMDHLAETGVRFAAQQSQSSWTKTSMAAIWTGIFPHRTGILRYNHVLPESALMPAEALQEVGFTTAGIWRNGWVSPTFGFHQGFESYHRPALGARIGLRPDESRNPYERVMGSDIEVTDSALEFLRTNGDDRFFLYVHYMDAHQYMSDAESAIFGSSYMDLYDNAIHWTDRHVAGLLGYLDEAGLRDKTIVVIASDHGEAFGEHGREGHAKDLHWEVTHVPWIVSFPFSLREGIVVESLTANVDIMPTLLDLLGQSPLPYADGRSRLPEILIEAGAPEAAEEEAVEAPVLAQLDRSWGKAEKEADPVLALTVPGRRYMRLLSSADAGLELGETEIPTRLLFDTDADPLERNDLMLVEGEPVDTAELDEIIDELWARPPPPWKDDVTEVELTDMQKGQLKAIGYAVE